MLVGVGDSSFVTFAGGTVVAAANIAVGAIVGAALGFGLRPRFRRHDGGSLADQSSRVGVRVPVVPCSPSSVMWSAAPVRAVSLVPCGIAACSHPVHLLCTSRRLTKTAVDGSAYRRLGALLRG